MVACIAPPLRFPTFANALQITNPSSTTAALTNTLTIVTKYLTGVVAATGTSVRFVSIAPVTGPMTLTNVYIGTAATTGNAYDFSGTPTQITFDGGQSSKTVTAGSGVFASDLVSFTVDHTKAVLIAYDLPIGAFYPYADNLTDNYISYFKLGVNEASDPTKGSGYTPVGKKTFILQLLQVNS